MMRGEEEGQCQCQSERGKAGFDKLRREGGAGGAIIGPNEGRIRKRIIGLIAQSKPICRGAALIT